MVICLNEARRIGDCLRSLAFCDEVVVIDSGSTDGTPAIIQQHGARLLTRPFVSWNDQKDFGREQATGPWVLNIDADEVVSEALAKEICARLEAGVDPSVGGFEIPFRNYLRSTWLRRAGFYPDPHLRLVRKDRARWDRGAVHDRLVIDGRIERLSGHVDHYSFDSIADYLEKSNIYAEAFARHAHATGRRTGAVGIAWHALARFVRAYFLELGVLEGALGLIMSSLQAAGTFQKYARLWELQRFGAPELPAPKLGDPWAAQRIPGSAHASDPSKTAEN